MYSKTCLRGHSHIDTTKVLKTIGILMKIESIAEFCNTFDLHLAIFGLENQFLVSFSVAAEDKFYCIYFSSYIDIVLLFLFSQCDPPGNLGSG